MLNVTNGTTMRTDRQPVFTIMAPLPAGEVGDAELVRRTQQHAAAFGPLYLRYRDRVLRYCLYRLGDLAEAEDATSAVFVKALHGITGVQYDDTSFRPWLFRIAHNEIVDRYKRRAHRSETALAAADDLVDPEPSLEEAAMTVEAVSQLRTLLGGLPSRERAVLELRLADLTTAEIAAVLGITDGSVWTAQSRGLAKVRDAMGVRIGSVRANA
ncbi:MAG: transcriptional regulator, LuxR family [Thermomicrobiales bacterium]|jgi:RNA polymerase sigma-70 factor (ECF subfamily)|nr:transcriptional regulator, LuxR family [Thermomicrobiales bacterium]